MYFCHKIPTGLGKMAPFCDLGVPPGGPASGYRTRGYGTGVWGKIPKTHPENISGGVFRTPPFLLVTGGRNLIIKVRVSYEDCSVHFFVHKNFCKILHHFWPFLPPFCPKILPDDLQNDPFFCKKPGFQGQNAHFRVKKGVKKCKNGAQKTCAPPPPAPPSRHEGGWQKCHFTPKITLNLGILGHLAIFAGFFGYKNL